MSERIQWRAVHGDPPTGFPSLQAQREYWLKKELEWVGCNGGVNDHYFEEQQYSNYSEEQL